MPADYQEGFKVAMLGLKQSMSKRRKVYQKTAENSLISGDHLDKNNLLLSGNSAVANIQLEHNAKFYASIIDRLKEDK